MLNRTSPIRLVLTLFLAAVLPFCCCDFRSLLTGCASCHTFETRWHATSSGVGTEPGRITHDHCHGHAPNGGDEPRTPPEETPEKSPHDCQCGKNTGNLLTVAKSTLELPGPVVVAILDWFVLPDIRPPEAIKGSNIGRWVLERPPTSLLRMHCALIV